MSIVSLIGSVRTSWISDSNLSPTREVQYTRFADNSVVTVKCFVGGGYYNKEEKDNLENNNNFSGLILSNKPEVNDTITYEGIVWKVQRWVSLGGLYSVFTEIRRGVGRPTKR